MTSSPEPAPDRRRYLGLDLGGTNIKVAVVQERDAGAFSLAEAVLGAYAGAAGAALCGREAAREALNTASIA
jgi:hypothetical protein